MDNREYVTVYGAKPSVIYQHVRGWVNPKHQPDEPMQYTIVGCMAGVLIDYHNSIVVHIGVSARNLDDKLDKEVGRQLALKRALDVSSTYKIHIPNCGIPQRLWEDYIKTFAWKCAKHFNRPILFPKGITYTSFPSRWDKKKAMQGNIPTPVGY